MKKALEIFIGVCGIAAIVAAIRLAFIEGIAAGLIFFLLSALFLGGFASIVEKLSNVLDKVFSPRR